jgi:hypothetical protein
MAQGDMTYLLPLFDLTDSLVDDDDPGNISFGLAEHERAAHSHGTVKAPGATGRRSLYLGRLGRLSTM